MDFIIVLPKSGKKSVVIVIIDRVSKYAHLYFLQHSFSASIGVQKFMDNIFKLHYMDRSIVSN